MRPNEGMRSTANWKLTKKNKILKICSWRCDFQCDVSAMQKLETKKQNGYATIICCFTNGCVIIKQKSNEPACQASTIYIVKSCIL